MDILNKEKLKQVLERWKGHPSIADLMDRFDKLQSYTKRRIKKPKFELVELFNINSEADNEFITQNDWIDTDKDIIIYSGAIGIVNGLSYMAVMAAEMINLNPNVIFCIIGDGIEKVIDKNEELSIYSVLLSPEIYFFPINLILLLNFFA